KLRQLAKLSFKEFSDETKDHFDVAKLRLREALEGVFNIGAHILSRLNGGRSREFKEIAKKLGEFSIVEKSFAEDSLVRMAGYRNRLTHGYADIDYDELYKILKNNLGDFDVFLAAVKKVLENPQQFGLEIE
ncbi:MAG: HepT-like ribonuclease domain-containing protein, partial [Patescibacteria group bacterium]